MSEIPEEYKYTESHEWVRIDDDTATIGITDHAQSQLGDIVFVELPEIGEEVTAKKQFAVIESVKAASDIYAPISGEVVEINDKLDQSPDTINDAPHDTGWIAKIKLSKESKSELESELESLLDADQYKAQIDNE